MKNTIMTTVASIKEVLPSSITVTSLTLAFGLFFTPILSFGLLPFIGVSLPLFVWVTGSLILLSNLIKVANEISEEVSI